MAIEEQQRPYAAPSNVLAVFQRVRSRNIPERIDDDFLRLAGVPDGAMHRVHSALRFLAMANENGGPTDTLRSLAAATDDQYRQILEGALRTAYEQDLERI